MTKLSVTIIYSFLNGSLFIIIRDQFEVVIVRVEFQPKNVTILTPSSLDPFSKQPDKKCLLDR